MKIDKDETIIIRGGGDLATGVIQAFFRCGFKVLVLETDQPTAIRRSVALCEAVYQGNAVVEDVECVLIKNISQAEECWGKNKVPLMVDPLGESISALRPAAVIDAILAKRNMGTGRCMAPITIGLGPGFCAGDDVDAVIETMRGHNLGRLILKGTALPNTGIPGEVGGKSELRVLHAPCEGIVKHIHEIGDVVEQGEGFFTVGSQTVCAPFKGLIRGLIREDMTVPRGMKVADIDPRTQVDWRTVSDKARALGAAALEGYIYLSRIKEDR